MKNVLILAYDFPPYVSVGGLRPYSWYKYLHQCGYYPIVVTRQWSNKQGNHLDYISAGSTDKVEIERTDTGTIIRSPYFPNFPNRLMLKHGEKKFSFVRKLASAYYEFAQFLLPTGPKYGLFEAAEQYLSEQKVDCIIATGDPFVLFRYASLLSKKFNIPWIADYRDFWSHYKYIQESFFLKKWHTHMEYKTVRTAKSIVVVSEFLERKIKRLMDDREVDIIMNGFDPEIQKIAGSIDQERDVFTISFAGTVYDWHPLRSFLHGFKQFVERSSNKNIRLKLYGVNLAGNTFERTIDELIKTEFPSLASYITITGKVPNIELQKELAKSNLLLLFNYYSYMGTKIFDYLALERLILFCYTKDERALALKDKYFDVEEQEGTSEKLQEEVLKEAGGAVLVENEEHLINVLTDLKDEFDRTRKLNCNKRSIDKFSRSHQVKELVRIIEKTIGGCI